MPRKYTRKNRRTNKRRRTFKRRPYKKRRRSMNLSRTIQPYARICKMRYVERTTLIVTTGIMMHHVFRANSVWDPSFTTTGHSCYYYDQMAAKYNHYTVYGSKMTVTASQLDNVPQANVVGVNLQPGSSSPAGWYWGTYIEAKQGEFRHMSASNAIKPVKFGATFSAKKFFNVKDVIDNQNLRAAVDTNPAEEAFFDLWMQPHDQVSDTAVDFVVVIDYIVKWTEPKDIDGS